jgi:hypothetical protein
LSQEERPTSKRFTQQDSISQKWKYFSTPPPPIIMGFCFIIIFPSRTNSKPPLLKW